MTSESPVVFNCLDDTLVGVIHHGHRESRLGVIIVVGGPQYRVGSHRQFVLMARKLAHAGFPVMRFDCRGMGDSEGEFPSFEKLEPDIQSAISAFRLSLPSLERVVLLGLCDAASAISLCCNDHESIAGLVLMNPWVRTREGEARAYVKHYYWQRLWQRSFWRKVFGGKFDFRRSFSGFSDTVKGYFSIGSDADLRNTGIGDSFVEAMLAQLEGYRGGILVTLSSNDLTANEFEDLCNIDERWSSLIARENVSIETFPGADHTLSNRSDLDALTEFVKKWLESDIIQ